MVQPVPKPNHKRSKPKIGDRNKFPERVRKQIVEVQGRCQECKKASIEEIHHVRPRSLGGRGVLTNGIGLCHVCHQKIEQDQALKTKWQEKFQMWYGEDYYKDEYDRRDIR